MTVERSIDLNCHPSRRDPAVRAIRVRVRRVESDELQLSFRLEGDISGILVPATVAPRIGNELWRHTCFEAFIAVDGRAAYHEFNFAPSREWTVYSFSGYRNGGPLADEAMRPEIAARSTGTRLELEATVRLDRLSAAHSRALLRVGLAAVVETADGLSYWALQHPSATPDFHHADGFALTLEPLGCAR